MKNGIFASMEGEIVSVCRKRHKNSEYLSFFAYVAYDPQRKASPIDSCQNCIRLPQTLKDAFGAEYGTLVNLENGAFADVVVDSVRASDAGEKIQMTNFLERTLRAQDGARLVLCRQNGTILNKIRVQKLENIKNDLVVTAFDAALEKRLKEFMLFEIIDPLTGDSIFVRSKYIHMDETLRAGEIRLNKKQRNMLGDNIPSRLTAAQWDAVMENPDVKESVKTAFLQGYGEDRTIKCSIEEMAYDVRAAIAGTNRKVFGDRLILRPVLESFRYEKKKGLARWLGDFYVGKSTISLNCRRPYESDENANIVRMTENNMQFLGIEPMDRVVIQYKENSLSCHVLPLDEERFKYTNIPTITAFSIGIPAHIRNQLEITDVQSAVKVDRDTAFIFRKNFNEQLVPVTLALLSLQLFDGAQWYVKYPSMALLVAVVMYITLSSKRNMRGR